MEIVTYDYEIHRNSKIIVYGVSGMGYIASCCLRELNVPVYRYADRTVSYHALFGNVISVEEMLAICEKEDVIILFTVTHTARSEVEYLSRRGIKRIYSVRKLWQKVSSCNMDWDDVYQGIIDNADRFFFTEDTIANPQKLYLYTLDAVVTERCSLKCKDCSNLMQYYQHPRDIDVYEIKESIDKLLSKDCRIFDLRILGGEPLMNRDFIKLVDWYKDEKKIDRISIYSNATIFPDDSILEHLKPGKVWVSLSDYGKFSYKLEEWTHWCVENHVKYEVKKLEKWQDCGSLERHDYCEHELLGIYSGCECRNLPTIIGEGYLYNCPYAANAANLGAMTLDEMNRDRLRLTDDVDEEEIDKFLYERNYLEACRYCRGRNLKQAEIEPCVQTRHPLAYNRLADTQLEAPINVFDNSTIKADELVSVVIPAFNMGEYIERCLTSVLKSSYQNLEVIVVDDGSEDDTVNVCRKIAEQDSLSRVKIIENKHEGVVKTRNTGILAARGKYITFVDADDYIDSDRIASMVKAIDGCDLVYAGYTWVQEDKQISDELMDRGQSKNEIKFCSVPEGIYEGEKYQSLMKYIFLNFVHSDNELRGCSLWNCIFRTDIMKNICGQVDPSIWYAEDMVLTQIYASYCNRICIIKNFGYYYCIRNVDSRYSMEGIMANMEKVYYCLSNGLKNNPKANLYERLLREECAELYHMGMGMWMDTCGRRFCTDIVRNIYYPYYGRLKGKKIILYGAGNVGKAYYRHMKDDGECLLVAWVDKNAKKIREEEFLPVEETESLYSKDYDYVVIAVYDEANYHVICKDLVNAGIREEAIVWNPTKYEL